MLPLTLTVTYRSAENLPQQFPMHYMQMPMSVTQPFYIIPQPAPEVPAAKAVDV